MLAQLDRDVLPFTSRGDHPGFFAFVPFVRDVAGRARGLHRQRLQRLRRLVDGGGRARARLELEVLDWFKDWVGYPARGRRDRS